MKVAESIGFGGYIVCKRLTLKDVKTVAGNLTLGKPIELKLPSTFDPDLTSKDEILFNKRLRSPIIRLSKKEHVDDFFLNGNIRLGTLPFYGKYEGSNEVRDSSEGSIILVVHHGDHSYFLKLLTGFHHYVLSCSLGEPSQSLYERFEYDAAFEITDPIKFAKAIRKKLAAINIRHAKCVYRNAKILIVNDPLDFNPMRISGETIECADYAQYFIKFPQYADQSEYRFVWSLSSHQKIVEPRVIQCKEAVKYCKRISPPN